MISGVSRDPIHLVGRSPGDRLRGPHSAADGWPNAFAQIEGRQSGRIAHQEGVVLAWVRPAVGAGNNCARWVCRYARDTSPIRSSFSTKRVPVLFQVIAVRLQTVHFPADAHVDIAIGLRHEPGIPRQVVFEEPQPALSRGMVVEEFLFLGDDQRGRRRGYRPAETTRGRPGSACRPRPPGIWQNIRPSMR